MHDCEKKECRHTNIRFCPGCGKAYCTDCGREWEDKCTMNHYPYYQPTTLATYPWYPFTYPYSTTISGDTFGCNHS